ncbi:MAG TPA: hypothetical protein VLG37_03800 [Candidatus Saccharimonadales bacterium]|nr:hypothetical protein [Candidatus Saccharimonadales bacterium]
MRIDSEKGAVSSLLLSFIVVVVLFAATLFFAVWAYQGRQDYKNNVDKKIAAAVELTKQQVSSAKDKEFAEKEKQPLTTYKGPSSYGSVTILYPKKWSGYVDATSNGSAQLDGYFYPGVVPALNDQNTAFALRVQVVSTTYDQSASDFSSQVEDHSVTVTPYVLPKVPNAVGIKVDGKISNDKTGTMVLLPLRDKTLKIWTEGSQFSTDFTNSILPNFIFSP